MKITKSRLIQIIKEEISKEDSVKSEKETAVNSLLNIAADDGKLSSHQLGMLLPSKTKKEREDLKQVIDKLSDIEYRKKLISLVDKEPLKKPS